MSRAEELLDSLTEEPIITYGINRSAKPHIVIESDKTITVPNKLKHIAVQGEHNIGTVTFDCPRYWDDHDLSQMQMRIAYQRPDGHREPYPVENLRVDDVDENTIHFDWTVSGNVTEVKGNISFMVCAKLSDSEGNIEREWHTRLNQDLIVDEGLDCSGEEIVEQNPDIIEAILVQLDDLKNTGGVSDEQIANAVAAYLAEHPIESGVNEQQVRDIIAAYLIEHPVEGGTVTDEQIADAVAAYFTENPIDVDTSGFVKSVNGNAPDANGNVTIHIPDSPQNSVYYVATDYGISTEADDNSPALQALIDMLHVKGGGVIWFPVGTYRFRKSGADADGKEYAVVPKSSVSILGESMEGTVLKQVDPFPYGMFIHRATADNPVVGCHFERFTVDAYETGNTNQVYGKAFHMKFVRDSVFRDLILRGTTATGMGVDFLDNVVIDRVYCIDCGRTWTGTEPGTSGIGIGTGGWPNENFVISNCTAVDCGQYGIFVENQATIFGFDGHEYSKGSIISNCVVRNGLNKGIGIRGGENITVIGCEVYENAEDGIYIDSKCRNVHISHISATANGGRGVEIAPDAESVRIAVKDCFLTGNVREGIHVATASDKLVIADNYTDGNTLGMRIEAVTLTDAVISNNRLLDGHESAALFTGRTDFVDLEEAAPTVTITLSGDDLTSGLKINPDGAEGTSSSGKVTGYLDVSGMGSPIAITTDGNTSSVRIAQYDSGKNSLVTDAALTDISGDGVHELSIEKLAGCTYIRLFYTSLDGTNPAVIRSILVEGKGAEPGGEVWETIIDYTVPEDCASVVLTKDINGSEFRLKKAHALFVIQPIDGAESLAANVQPAYTFQAADANPYSAQIYRYGFANVPRTAGKVTMAAFTLIDTGNGVALLSYKHAGEINYYEDGYGALTTVASGQEQVNQDSLEYKLREITACSVGGHAKCIGVGTRIKMMGVRA